MKNYALDIKYVIIRRIKVCIEISNTMKNFGQIYCVVSKKICNCYKFRALIISNYL